MSFPDKLDSAELVFRVLEASIGVMNKPCRGFIYKDNPLHGRDILASFFLGYLSLDFCNAKRGILPHDFILSAITDVRIIQQTIKNVIKTSWFDP